MLAMPNCKYINCMAHLFCFYLKLFLPPADICTEALKPRPDLEGTPNHNLSNSNCQILNNTEPIPSKNCVLPTELSRSCTNVSEMSDNHKQNARSSSVTEIVREINPEGPIKPDQNIDLSKNMDISNDDFTEGRVVRLLLDSYNQIKSRFD